MEALVFCISSYAYVSLLAEYWYHSVVPKVALSLIKEQQQELTVRCSLAVDMLFAIKSSVVLMATHWQRHLSNHHSL